MDTLALGPIKAGSYSRLDVYEACPYRARLAFIDKIPEPVRSDTHPAARGSRIHEDAELFVRGLKALPQELQSFSGELNHLKELYKQSRVATEETWAFDFAWRPTRWDDWDNTWVRIKTDITVFREIDGNLLDEDLSFDFSAPRQAVVIDLKTGKRYGNEFKHAEQCTLYAIGAFKRYPKLEHVVTELWYSDADDLYTVSFDRDQAMQHFPRFNDRLLKMTTATDFPPTPSRNSCRWCPYASWGTGNCQVGFR